MKQMRLRTRHVIAALIIAAVTSVGGSSRTSAGLVAVGVADSMSMHHDRVATVAAPGVLANDLNLLGGTTAVLISSTRMVPSLCIRMADIRTPRPPHMWAPTPFATGPAVC